MTMDLTAQAINAALNGQWPQAIKINEALVAQNSDDIEALNRLARAYKESGNLQKAQKNYRKVLTLDKFNPIAQKNLKLLDSLPKTIKKSAISNCIHSSPQMFLEEPGKTKIVCLVNLAPTLVLSSFCPGHEVNLLVKRHTVIVVDEHKIYLGALPDDLSTKLIKRLNSGNRYEVFIKTVGKNSLSIFIRETFRTAKFKNQPTFPAAGYENYASQDQETSWQEEETPTETTEEEPLTILP